MAVARRALSYRDASVSPPRTVGLAGGERPVWKAGEATPIPHVRGQSRLRTPQPTSARPGQIVRC